MPERTSSRRAPGTLVADHPADMPRGARPVIGVSMLTVDVEFHRELKAGLEKAGREAGFELVCAVADYSPAEQDAQLAAFVGGGVDAILLTPCDSASAGASIEQANRLDVPVFTMDVAVTGGRGEVVSHVASDNFLGGWKAGELMARALGGQGNVAIVTHPGVTSVDDRDRGFREALSASAERLLVVGELPVWRHSRAKAAGLVRRLLAGATVDGLFCMNSELTMGAVEGVGAAGKVGQVVVVGFDGAREVWEAIQQGRIHGDVIQHPEAIAAMAIGAIRDHLAGRPVPPAISADVDVRTVSPAPRAP